MIRHYLALPAAGALLALTIGTARAQATAAGDAPPPSSSDTKTSDGGPRDDDIVVTARRVSESQQRVPVSLTAISGDILRQKDVTTVLDLPRLAPSLNVTASLSRDTTTFTIRGQRATASTAGTGGGPSVVAYFAEATTTATGPGLFFDLSSVQVLNGPQGTLFGKNTTGGAILFEPQRPTNSFEGYMQGTVGSYGRLDAEGVVNLPIIDDKLLLRVGAQEQTREGFTRNITTGRKYDDRNVFSGRASLLFKPSSSFENLTIGYVNNSEENGPGIVLIAVNPAARLAPLLLPILAAQQARGIRAVSLDAKSRDARRTIGFVNRTTLNLGSNLTLTNIFSFVHGRSDSARDDDGTPYAIQDSNGALPGTWSANFTNLTEELRLSGGIADDLLKFQVGGYTDSVRPVGPQTYTQNLQLAATTSQLDATTKTKSYAGFGQAQIDMGKLITALKGLNLTAGYRYTKNKNAFDLNILLYPGILRPPPQPIAGVPCLAPPTGHYPNCVFGGSKTDNGVSYHLGTDYQLTSKVMLFANYKRGFKAGGFNPFVLAYGGSADAPAFSYLPEKVDTTEAGIKTEWSLGSVRGRFNVTGYLSKYRNIQASVPVVIGNFTTGVIQNAARATIKGLEADGSIRFNNLLSFDAGYSHIDARYDKYVAAGVDLSSLPFVYTPKNQYNISGNLTLPLPPEVGSIVLRGTYSWQDRVYAGTTQPNQPFSYIEGYGLVNARLEWNNFLNTKNVDVAFFATNLTNKIYRISVIQQYLAAGYTTAIFGEPRMYGASLRVHF
jgi:iron complex outermembrane receptor protein